MESKSLLRRLQQLAIWPYPERQSWTEFTLQNSKIMRLSSHILSAWVPEWSILLTFSNILYSFLTSCVCYAPRPLPYPWFDHTNNINLRVQIMKLITVAFSSATRYSLSLLSALVSKTPYLYSLVIRCSSRSSVSEEQFMGWSCLPLCPSVCMSKIHYRKPMLSNNGIQQLSLFFQQYVPTTDSMVVGQQWDLTTRIFGTPSCATMGSRFTWQKTI
jgi:hypothetical protein